jgi:hypothetical protein
MYGKQNQCRLPVANKVVITNSGGTYTAGSLVTVINGVTITSAWATDKATAMAAHVTALLAGVADILSCAYDGSAHTITVILKNTTIASCATSVAGITGTMTISSETITSTDVAAGLIGVAVNPGAIEQVSDVVVIDATKAVSVMEEGAIYVTPEETVTSDDDVYFRVQTNSTKLAGMFGTSADSGKCVLVPGARWVEGGTGLSATALAKLQLNLPA